MFSMGLTDGDLSDDSFSFQVGFENADKARHPDFIFSVTNFQHLAILC